MPLGDYHIHTPLCGHAQGAPEAYVRRALECGLVEIGFSDHLPAMDASENPYCIPADLFETYIQSILKLRDSHRDIQIQLGVEVDLNPGFEDHLSFYLDRYPIDYVIGSIHFIDGLFIFPKILPDLSEQQQVHTIDRYYELIASALHSQLLDVVGHLDAVKWLFPEREELISEKAIPILDAMSDTPVVLELNTSGLRKKPNASYPNSDIIEWAVKSGIPIILSSDAHSPEQVGMQFNKMTSLVKRFGYTNPRRCIHKFFGFSS